MKGDLDAVSKWKEREIDRIDAETAQAARWGAERFRKDLANLDTLDAQGRLNVGSADGALPTRTPLVAMHFLSSKHLAAALKRKGLPSPSIAVAGNDADWNLPNDYGDCLLFFGKDTVDPKADPRNAVFPADAMTTRYPKGSLKRQNLKSAMLALNEIGWKAISEEELRREAIILAVQPGLNRVDEIETPALFAIWVHARTGEKLPDPESVRAYAERFRDPKSGVIDPTFERRLEDDFVTRDNFFSQIARFGYYADTSPTTAKTAQDAFDAIGIKYRQRADRDAVEPIGLYYAAMFSFDDIESARKTMSTASEPLNAKTLDLLRNRLLSAIDKPGVPPGTSSRRLINDLAKHTTLKGALTLFETENPWYATTPEARQALIDLVRYIRNAKPLTHYYEAKPQRVVGLGEIALALIPASEVTLRRELENRSIPYETYNASSTHALEETSDVAQNAIARARFQIGGSTPNNPFAYDRDALLAVIHNAVDLSSGNKNKPKQRARFTLCAIPPILRWLGLPEGELKATAYALRKIVHDHTVSEEQLADLPAEIADPVAVYRDSDGTLDVLTTMHAPDRNGRQAPIMAAIRALADGSYLVSAYSRTKDAEAHYTNIANAGGLLYVNKEKAALITLEDEASSSIKTSSKSGSVKSPADYNEWLNTLDTNTVAYPGADVNPRRSIGGLYSGAPVAYDRPSLKAVGSNTGSLAYGWGLYATTYKYAAMSYAQDALHEQVWWINRPEGDESHLLVWDEPISQENRERWLAAINSLGLDPRELAHFSYGEDWATHEMTGRQAYDFVEAIARYIIENAHPKQFASTLLARFDIDGMKYGNTYVAFSDEHLRVVRRWVWDPQAQDFALDTTLPAPEPRRSIGGWLDARRWAREDRDDDARFARAHAEGDRATAEALVRKHAARAGYTHEAWRGSDFFGETDLARRYAFAQTNADGTPAYQPNGRKARIFFAGDPAMAGTYARNPEVRDVATATPLKPYTPTGDAFEDQWGAFEATLRAESGVYHVALRLDDPLVIDAQGATWDTIPTGDGHVTSTDALGEQAKADGHDGVIIHNILDYNILIDHGAPHTPGTVYIVFRPEQVKSLDPFTYDDSGNLIPLSQRFDTAQPDIRRSIGGVAPSATSARQKDAHGAYPDLGDVIAGARFSVGAKRKQEYRALIAKARPNLPQADVDAFMRELDTLNDTKTEKAALHWFVKGALILPEDREKLDMAVRMSGKWHLDFQAFDTPAALINEANARAEAKKKKPAPAYLDPDAVPQLSNKRDLGHGVVVYDVEDSPAGQQAMRQIMNSHLGRNADGEFWSPWCLLTCSPKTGELSESARKYWAHYNKTGRAAAFHNGKLCAFQSSDTKRKKWWDLNDENHGTKIPLPLTITSAEMGYASDDIPGDIVIQNGYEMTKDGELVPVAKPGGRTLLVGTRGSIAEGKTEKWIFASRSVFKAETSFYKDGVLYKSVSSSNPAYTIIRFYSDGNQSVAQSSYVGSPYYDRTIKDSNGLTLREDRRLTEEEANQNPFDNPDWRSVTLRNGDRRTEYNGGTDWTYEVFENGTRIFYAEYRDAGGRGRSHGRTEYIDDDTGALVTEYYDHGEQVDHPVVNERIVPGQGTPQPRRQVGGNARRAPIEATTRTARIGVFREAQRRPGNGTGIDAKRLVHVADLPDWASRYGLPSALMANGRVLRKLAKKHAFTPELFADLIEAMARPVAGFTDNALRNQRGSKGANDLVLLLALLTPTRQGGRGPTLAVLGSMNGHAMLTTAYGHDHGTENKLVGLVNGGYARWVDKTRVAKLPLLAETQFSLNSFNGPSDPSLGTVPNPGEEVKPGARLEVGGAERRLREANARVRTAALYYGRNPAVAEVANRAIAEIALFNEASRTGKKVSRETVKSAYADFGIQADDADAAQIADRLNAMAKSERWSPRDKQGLSPRDALIPQERHLRATYDIHWSQAEKTAYTRGVEGAFGAARALARDAQEIAQTKRAEAEGVLGLAPAASLAKDLCTLDFRNAASEIDDFAKSALSPYRDIQKAVRNLSGHDLDDLWEENETARRLRVRRQMAEAARRNADEVFADIRGRPDYAETRARIEAEMEAEQAFWAKAKTALRKCGITGKLAEDILDRLWELGYYEHQTGKASAEPVH